MADIQTKLGEDLLVAVKNDDETGVVELLKNEANYISVEGRFPLLLASFGGHEKIAQLLIVRGATVDMQGPLGMTALTVASERGHHNIVQLLGEHGVNVEHIAQNGLTPLLLASRNGHADTVEELLKLKARVILCVKHSDTVLSSLMLASEHGHTEVVRLLLPQFESVDKLFTSHNGLTPLMVASANGHASVAELLLQKGAQVNLRSCDRFTPLLFAALRGDYEVASVLLKHGAKVDLRTSDGSSALYKATLGGYTQVVKVLLDYNAEVDVKLYKSQRTALMCACEKHYVDIVQLLLQEKEMPGEKPVCETNKQSPRTDVNVQDINSRTALSFACINGDVEVVNMLLKSGAMVNPPESSPLVLATKHGHAEIVGILLENNADPNIHEENLFCSTALCYASKRGDLEIVRMLIKHSAKIEPPKEHFYSPLLLATIHKHAVIVQVLLENGADPNVRTEKYSPTSDVIPPPLIIATVLELLYIVELLLKHGANVDIAFCQNEYRPRYEQDRSVTALMLAIFAGDSELVELLVRNGSNAQCGIIVPSKHSFAYDKFTCTDLANASGDRRIIQLLHKSLLEGDPTYPTAKQRKLHHTSVPSDEMFATVQLEYDHVASLSPLFKVSKSPKKFN